MPEIAEVRHVAEQLNHQLAGKLLLKIILTPRLESKSTTNELFQPPYLINNVATQGKRILINLIHPRSLTETYTLVSWLGMTGRWDFETSKHTQAVLICATPGEDYSVIDTIMYYNNTRFGMLDIIPSDHLQTWLETKVGPDLIDNPPTCEEWIAHWYQRNHRRMKQQVCQVLMDQKFYAGIGNYLKAEILYRSGIHPAAIARDLTIDQLTRLHTNILKTVQEAYENGGATLKDYITPDGKKGRYQQQLLVYQQQKCPTGHLIQKSTFNDKRTTHWCPECQPLT